MIEFFEEELFSWLISAGRSGTVQKMSFEDKATITYMILDDVFYLSTIYVEIEHRGQGLANKILKRITEQADKYKVNIQLDVVPMCNKLEKKDLIRLYEKHGFKVFRFQEIPGMLRKAS